MIILMDKHRPRFMLPDILACIFVIAMSIAHTICPGAYPVTYNAPYNGAYNGVYNAPQEVLSCQN